jgi:hypothetical protein
MRGIRHHLTYANVMATLAIFIVLGGGAYAAFHLPRNSVRSNNIVNRQVKAKDLAKPQPLRSAHLASIGPFPDTCADTPDQWVSFNPPSLGPVGYYREVTGRVFLSGVAERCGSAGNAIFTLPRGYRPAKGQVLWTLVDATDARELGVFQNGIVNANFGNFVRLSGLSFRCGPSGKHGCP